MLKFNIVTANEIWQTSKISFKFIFDSKMPYENHAKVDNWGAIIRDLSNNERLVNIFNSDGLVFGWGNEILERMLFMYGKDVIIELNGVKFKVFVLCNSNTSDQELQNKAINQILKAFEMYSISFI